MSLGGAIALGLLQGGEVEVLDRVLDQAPLVVAAEGAARDLLGGVERERRDLGADLLERPRRLGLDLPSRLLEPPLAVLLGLLADALAHRVRHAARLGEDLLGLAAGAGAQLAMLLQQLAGLVARALRLLERLTDPLAPLVDDLLHRPERVALEHEERDPERDQRPDHQAGDDLDQRVGCERHGCVFLPAPA